MLQLYLATPQSMYQVANPRGVTPNGLPSPTFALLAWLRLALVHPNTYNYPSEKCA